jgi:phenylpropionate dioxygenase-like ring-hydroxylating dioxygenase large terminal subunit
MPRLPNEPDLRTIGAHPDFWYPLARSPDVARGRMLRASFAGEPIVIVRTASDKLFALEDRCAHRQLPLSMGVVAGEEVTCCYHAWRYDASGRCTAVPYFRKGMEFPAGVRAYPCREAYDHIFVFPGDPARAAAAPFPEIYTWASPDHATMYFSREVRCHYSFLHENLMDMNHQFLHRTIMGGIRATLVDTRRGPGTLEVDYAFERTAGRETRGAWFMAGGRGTRRADEQRDVMTIATRYPYQTLELRRPGEDTPAFRLWAAYVPLDRAQRTTQAFGLLVLRKPRIPGLVYLAWPFMRYFTERVFAEDRMAVEAEQRAHDELGGDWNQEIFPVVRELKDLLRRSGARIGDGAAAPPRGRPAAARRRRPRSPPAPGPAAPPAAS